MIATNFRVIDIAPDTLMQVVVNAANRAHSTGTPTTVSDIQKATALGKPQAQGALTMLAQLRLLSDDGQGNFSYAGPHEVRNSPREGLPQFFRAALQQFPPFVLYINFVSKGYSEGESSRQTVSIFQIGLASNRVQSIFSRWARYAGVIRDHGQLDFTPVEMLSLGFLTRLHSALRDELSTQNFVVDELGAAFAGDLYSRGLDLNSIGRALAGHEGNPKEALREVGSLLEGYLAPASATRGGPGSNLGDMADFLASRAQKAILKTHRNLSYGVAGFRNAANHGSDPDTALPWTLTSESALVGTLLVLVTIKSIGRFWRDGTQEV